MDNSMMTEVIRQRLQKLIKTNQRYAQLLRASSDDTVYKLMVDLLELNAETLEHILPFFEPDGEPSELTRNSERGTRN
jgi:hypothetical protein